MDCKSNGPFRIGRKAAQEIFCSSSTPSMFMLYIEQFQSLEDIQMLIAVS
ncbi:hypothetical protein P4C99_12355 [Pontiellaceae bacterium B1224]|nr:hypothetical protein [Pontiellaceae bacterium B1224]